VAEEYDFDYMPWFGDEFYEDDKVDALSDKGETWYMRCIWRQWKQGSVPLDEQAVRKIARPEFGTTATEWDDFYRVFPKLFPPIDEYRGRNPKVERVRKDSIRVFKAKRKGGKKSGETRRQQRDERDAA
jgi:hypothetical protein